MKRIYFAPLLILTFSLVSCKQEIKETLQQYSRVEGQTMGTTYHIVYDAPASLKDEIDSLLVKFNNSVSTYIPTSTISKSNKSATSFCYPRTEDQFFIESLSRALEIAKETDGYFDPTVMPLVNYWGFGYGERKQVQQPDQNVLDSLKSLVNYKGIGILGKNDSICIFKERPGMQIDLSASAKGHGVDVVASMLASLGIENYMVEIGGEIVTSGVNEKGDAWVIGINKPTIGAGLDEVQLPVNLSEKAMATSGNYRNFYESGEIVYAHIVNPKTGLSYPSDILSASVIANDCLTADAYATACMVLGLEKSIKLIQAHPDLEACFIFANEDKSDFKYYLTEGFKQRIDSTIVENLFK